MDNLHEKSAVELVGLIAKKALSSREITGYFIERIEKVNPRLNAVVIKLFDEALRRADEADARLARDEPAGRLHGLPFTIKECFDYPGTPSTLGVLARRDDRPATVDPYVGALMDEGGIVLGKTNVPQLLIFIESENRVYGRTNNPHNPEFTCGGSSGGEGAIIGAGASPVGVGSDIGGSVRFPAAFCGIASVKPTMWRIPDLTRYGAGVLEGPIGAVAGPLGNFAEDLSLVLGIMNETAARTRKVEPLADYRKIDPKRLRIGHFHSDGIFEPMPAVRRAVDESVARLRDAGAETVEFDLPPLDWAEEIFYRILTVNRGKIFTDVLEDEKPLPQLRNTVFLVKASPAVRRAVGTLAQMFGQRTLQRLLPYFGGEGEEFLNEWSGKQELFRRDFLARMESARIDAVISPISAVPGFLHRTTDKIGLGGFYSPLYNLLGFPAGIASVSKVRADEARPRRAGLDLRDRTAARIEKSSAGLPLSVQIAARPWREDVVLALIELLHRPRLGNG